jgi:hypothetical protein
VSARWDHVFASTDEIRHRLDVVERRLDTMQTILIVREPTSVSAGDAYDGLRKQVVSAVSERIAHLSQLVQIDAALAQGPGDPALSGLVDGWLEQAALRRVSDTSAADFDILFELVEDLGGDVEVLTPAYVDETTGRVIRQGRARRTGAATAARRTPSVEAPALDEPVPTISEPAAAAPLDGSDD